MNPSTKHDEGRPPGPRPSWPALLAGILIAAAAGSSGAAEPQASPLASLPRHAVIGEKLHASGQPSAQDIASLPASGIRNVIDLRPDAETPDFDEKAAVEQAGLRYRSLPISGAADFTRENVVKFHQLLEASKGEETLVHCASSNRVGALMALRARWLQGKNAAEALAIGKAAGMTSLEAAVAPLLEGAPAE